MLVSYNWLNEYVSLEGYSGQDLAEIFSRTGLEVERVFNFAEGLSGLVVGLVESLEAHPDSDRLSVAQVRVGEDDIRQIVCGAPNVAAGQKVIVALEGAELPGMTIGETKLRGVESQGMICSLQELGFSDSVIEQAYVDGIQVLPSNAPLGADIIEYLDLDDPIFEFDLTPNRADALSMRGVAYEAGAMLDRPVTLLPAPEAPWTQDQALAEALSVKIEDQEAADHYSLRVIQGIQVGPSPLDLQMKLMKSGMRPINNIVDVTNYYLLESGQPLHAFDYDRLPGHEMAVRFAREGETLVTLDEVERHLTQEDMVITANDQPVALAGVMGGLATEVTASTRTVALESAVFNPLYIRKTANRLDLRSESSARNEKGVNRATVVPVSVDASALMAQLGQGSVENLTVQEVLVQAQEVEISVPKASLVNKLGIEVSDDELVHIMDRLGFEVTLGQEDFVVSVPPRRWDLHIEADILEEVARIYGYDRIPSTLPETPSIAGKLSDRQRLIRYIGAINEGFGLNEVVSYVLTSPEEAEFFRSSAPLVELRLPLSQDRSILRQSLFPAMLEIAMFNQARKNQPLAFYEIGRVFYGQGRHTQPLEKERLAMLVSGQKKPSTWDSPEVNYDFYDLKGMIEELFDSLRLTSALSFQVNSEAQPMHPGRTASVYLDGESIGIMGQIHPQVASDHDLPRETFFAELDLEAILTYSLPALSQLPIPRYPQTARDLALLVDQTVTNDQLLQVIQDHAGDDLHSVSLFDLYQGESIAEDKKSLAYHLVFMNPDRTLRDDEIDPIMEAIEAALIENFDLKVR